MPRPPKHPHILRDIRALAGNLTQPALAQLVGVAAPTIQALENGKLRMTATLAARIAEATGVAAPELLKGGKGKALMLDGRKFTAASFQGWQLLQQRRTKSDAAAEGVSRWLQWLLEAAQSTGPSALASARTQIVEAMERVRVKLKLEDELNALFRPFQTVETYAGEVLAWKMLEVVRFQGLGYHSSLPLGPKTHLTVSLQSLPSWAPGTVPPGPTPTNMDLIPAGYFVIGLGTAGCRMAHGWWQDLVAEHGIDPQTGHALYGSATGNWQGFLRKVPQLHGLDKYVPRAIFADLDAESMRALTERNGDLFHSGAFFTDEQGSANVFAGATHAGAERIMKGLRAMLNRYTQDIGGLSGVFLLHSLEGGTGAGLAHQLLAQLKEGWPGCPVVSVCPIPDPELSHSVTAPYNVALSLQAVRDSAQAAFFFDPAVLQEQAQKLWKLPLRELENAPNLLISSMLCSITAPLRFPGGASAPLLLADWLQAISGSAPAPAFFWPEITPLQARFTPKKLVVTAAEMVKASIPLWKGKVPPPARITLLLRARQAEDLWGTGKVLSGSEAQFRLSSRRNPQGFESMTILTEAGGLGARLQIFADQAAQLLRRKAYLHWYAELGLAETALEEAAGKLTSLAAQLR